MLSPIEEAKLYRALRTAGVSTRAIANLIDRPVQEIFNRLALLRLPDKKQEAVHKGKMQPERAIMWLHQQAAIADSAL